MSYKIIEVEDLLTELIPETILLAFLHKHFKPLPQGYIRVTELIDSPLRRKLIYENYENIERNHKTVVNLLLGTVVHQLLELKEFSDKIKELILAKKLDNTAKIYEIIDDIEKVFTRKTLEIEFENWKIQGTYDYYDPDFNVLYDYKCTSQFVITNKKFDIYEKQLQIYRYMFEKIYQVKLDHIRNVFLIKDFSLLRAIKNENFIQSPLVVVEYEIWDDLQVEAYLKERLKLFEMEAPYCTDEDMWVRPQYFVGNKMFSSKEKAEEYCQKYGKPISSIKISFSEPIRCLYFCEVSSFCPQFLALQTVLPA